MVVNLVSNKLVNNQQPVLILWLLIMVVKLVSNQLYCLLMKSTAYRSLFHMFQAYLYSGGEFIHAYSLKLIELYCYGWFLTPQLFRRSNAHHSTYQPPAATSNLPTATNNQRPATNDQQPTATRSNLKQPRSGDNEHFLILVGFFLKL